MRKLFGEFVSLKYVHNHPGTCHLQGEHSYQDIGYDMNHNYNDRENHLHYKI